MERKFYDSHFKYVVPVTHHYLSVAFNIDWDKWTFQKFSLVENNSMVMKILLRIWCCLCLGREGQV